MSQVKIDEHNIFTIMTVGSSCLLALLVTCGALLISLSFALGTAVGGTIAIINGRWLHRILKRTMQLPAPQAVRYAWLRYLTRLCVIALITVLLLVYGKINVFGLLLGLSVVVITIMAMAVYLASQRGG